MDKFTVYLTDKTGQEAREDAHRKGQSLTIWMERAIVLALSKPGRRWLSQAFPSEPKEDEE